VRCTTQLSACTVALLVVTLGACSSDGSDDPTPSPTTSAASSPTDSTSPTESSEPTVTPASGPVLDTGSATINLPEGWKDDGNGLPSTFSGTPEKGSAARHITIIDLTSTPPAYSVDKLARNALTELPGAKLSRLPDTVLDGSPAYHVTGTAPVRGEYDEVGTDSHGRSVEIGFSLNGYTPAERTEIIESVIASFQWTA
jgi:hypothetical protein